MVSFNFEVDTTQDLNDDFAPLPEGWYTAQVAEVSDHQTKAGNGRYIKVRYDIQGPTHSGRVVFGNINYQNANEVAERIGRQQIGKLATAAGITQLRDSDQLVGATVQIKLTIRKSEEYGDSNDVKAFKPAGSVAPPAQQLQAAAAAVDGKVTAAAPPWARK